MDLPYLIMIKKEVIASFQNKMDRDDFLHFLADRYPDVIFKAKMNRSKE